MQIEATKKLFNVDEYDRMAAAGILGPEDRVELIDGEIFQVSPQGVRHARCVMFANNAFVLAFARRVIVSVQAPLRLSNYTEPEPDIFLLKPREDYYRDKRVTAEDAMLVVEVADATLRYDRDVKVPRYATASIPEVWIEDLHGEQLLVYRDPEGGRYKTFLTLQRGDSVSAQAFPDITFSVDELLG